MELTAFDALDQLAARAFDGYIVRKDPARFVGRGSTLRRETYLRAVTQGYLQNYAELVSFFVEAVRRRERDKALR